MNTLRYSTGPSAAFFDLDRTLISGSSAFVLGIAAWRGKLVPTRQFVRDAVERGQLRRSPAPTTTRPHGVRDRILGAVTGVRVDDLVALNADIVPEAHRPGAAGVHAAHRAAPRRRPGHVHRVGVAGRARRAAGEGARHDGRHRHAQQDRRRRLHRRARRAVLLRRGQGGGHRGDSRRRERFDLDRCWAYSDSASDLPMLQRRRPSGGGEPRRQARAHRRATRAGRSSSSASAARPSSVAPLRPSAPSAWPRAASPPASVTPAPADPRCECQPASASATPPLRVPQDHPSSTRTPGASLLG